MLITFFYTRCQNGKKCSAAVTRWPPSRDSLPRPASTTKCVFSPSRMNLSSTRRNGSTDTRPTAACGSARTLWRFNSRCPASAVRGRVGAPVGYNAGWVTTHGVELSLLDADGRVVRKYHTLLWENDQVAEDLRRVIGTLLRRRQARRTSALLWRERREPDLLFATHDPQQARAARALASSVRAFERGRRRSRQAAHLTL